MKLAALLLLVTACQQSSKSEPTAATAPSASGSVTPPAPAAPTRAWFEGAWQGVYRAELLRIELPIGGVKEWKQDDGKQASGEGKLAFAAAPDGSVVGTASGALGELLLSGRIDGDRAALLLAAAGSEGFHGVILASQTPEGMQGTLNASSADSLQVRQASVTLARAK